LRGWREILAVGASVLLIVVFAALGIGLASLPAPREEKRVAGLAETARVLFDSDGVPYVFAADFNAAAFALGYAHARDRMWQMDLSRHAAEGRLSELFGDRAVRSDRRLRALELRRIARASLVAASPDGQNATDLRYGREDLFNPGFQSRFGIKFTF